MLGPNRMDGAKMPRNAPSSRLATVALLGGAAIYGAYNSLFNVEGGHRAIVFNRLTGVKEEVSSVLMV